MRTRDVAQMASQSPRMGEAIDLKFNSQYWVVKIKIKAAQWLKPIILATWEAEDNLGKKSS
jgi:hypothetical protein